MGKIVFRIAFLSIFIFGAFELHAHEIRPAYLEVKETTTGSYNVLWKIPMLNGMIPTIEPLFDNADSLLIVSEQGLVESYIKRYSLLSGSSLSGSTIRFNGLEQTLIDVLIYVEYLDGTHYSLLAQPSEPYITIPIEPSLWSVISTYTKIGVEHILLGIDHLLFVLCLILIIPSIKALIQTITAFTIAHSLTLVGSTLGYISLPGPPVEAIIALSIVFLAREYLLSLKGIKSIAAERPWIVAFIFGLLHGFGFAGALSEVGLPQKEIGSALLFFNVGVEIGQVIFVIIIALMIKVIAKNINLLKWVKRTMAYGIGGVSVFWLIERIIQF